MIYLLAACLRELTSIEEYVCVCAGCPAWSVWPKVPTDNRYDAAVAHLRSVQGPPKRVEKPFSTYSIITASELRGI